MPRTKKVSKGYAAIDVALVVIRTGAEEGGVEYAIDTSNKVGIEPQIETQEAIKLMKGSRLLAQKPATSVVTGNTITWTNNVFHWDIVKVLQGGKVSGETVENMTYTPPLAGSGEEGEVFDMDLYSAVYGAGGTILSYIKTTYPNCKGMPIAMNFEDNVFTVPEYTINSAPETGQPPYKIEHVKQLPVFEAMEAAQTMSVAEAQNKAETGMTTI